MARCRGRRRKIERAKVYRTQIEMHRGTSSSKLVVQRNIYHDHCTRASYILLRPAICAILIDFQAAHLSPTPHPLPHLSRRVSQRNQQPQTISAFHAGGIPPFQQAKRPPRSSTIRAHSMQGCDTIELAPSETHCRLSVGGISGEDFSPGCLRPWLLWGYVRTLDGIESSVLENQWRWRPANHKGSVSSDAVRSKLSSLGCCVPGFGCRARTGEWLIFSTAFRLLCL